MINTKNNKSSIFFIHANGFPPDSYKSLYEKINSYSKINNFLLRPLWKEYTDHKILKDWGLFHNDFLGHIKNNNLTNIIGIGHSIGGNIILKSAILEPKYFSKIILLDPTLFTPFRIFIWKLILLINLQDNFHPFLKRALNRKMSYSSYDEIFSSYRSKHIFKKINDLDLNNYIKSITKKNKHSIDISYSNKWEYQIYKTGLVNDSIIWNNIKKLKIPCLIIRAENSNAFLDSSERKIKKLNPNIQFKTLPNSSHLFPLEFPSSTSDIILSFIK